MFKTIFTTLMLCTSIGTPIIKSPSKLYTSNTIYGMYSFRNEFLTPETLVDFPLQEIYNWGEYGDIRCYLYEDNAGYGNYVTVRHIDLGVGGDSYELYISVGEDYVYIDSSFNNDEGVLYFSSDRYRYFTLYVPTPTYLSDTALMYFKCFFTGTGNNYVTYYDGYYNLGAYPLNNTGTNGYNVYGNFIIDNNVYTEMTFDYGNNDKIIAYGQGNPSGYVVYENNAYKTANRNVLIQNTLLPYPIRAYLSNSGTFTYVPPTTTNDFADLIFSVMDAPVYYLTSLFSFELFGIQFYIAFMSIVTLLLIVAVVRKVI